MYETIHFNVGKITGSDVAPVAGTPDVDALEVFGQLNIATSRHIAIAHCHLIKGGTGVIAFDLFRRRSGVLTLIGNLSRSNPSDYQTFGFTLYDINLKQGDYLFCQLTDAEAIQSGGANGITVDIHFKPYRANIY
jgi:hypothetical protein